MATASSRVPTGARPSQRRRFLYRGLAALAAGALATRVPARELEAAPGLDGETDPLSIHTDVQNNVTGTTSLVRASGAGTVLEATAMGSGARGGIHGSNEGGGYSLSHFGIGGNDGSGEKFGAGTFGISHTGGAGVYGSGLSGSTGVRASADPGGVALEVLGTSTFTGAATLEDQVAATKFKGSGHLLVSLNASNLGLGTVPDARLSANVPRLNTGIPASSLTGTIDDARQSRNVALKNGPSNTFKGHVIARVFGGAPRTGGAPAFSKAGTATIAKGHDRVSVTTTALKRDVSVLTTLEGSPGPGVVVSHVERRTGGFDIVLSAPANARTPVAYLLFRQG